MKQDVEEMQLYPAAVSVGGSCRCVSGLPLLSWCLPNWSAIFVCSGLPLCALACLLVDVLLCIGNCVKLRDCTCLRNSRNCEG